MGRCDSCQGDMIGTRKMNQSSGRHDVYKKDVSVDGEI